LAAYGLLAAAPELVAASQLGAAGLNLAALVPQLVLNYQHKSKEDYSPVTVYVAATGWAIRFLTINQLTDSDPILLASFGVALAFVGESILSKKNGDGPNVRTTDEKCQQPTVRVRKVTYADTVRCVPQNRSPGLRSQ
jgi:hypothetical protein